MKNEKLIKALQNCIQHCNYCADACLDVDNVKMMVNCIRTDRACAEVCNTLLKLLSSNFEEIEDLVRSCKNICNQCADECGKHDMDHCKACAKACKECAIECEKYLN